MFSLFILTELLMAFLKDILVIDFEGSRYPKQIGAVLLDRETLVEKDFFESYIYADMGTDVSMKSGITQDMLTHAPHQEEIGKILHDRFGTNIFIGSFVSDFDIKHFKTILTVAGFNVSEYDYHILDIWPIAYAHLVKNGYTGKPNSEEIFQAFGAQPRGRHNALEDARISADVLRQVMLKM